MDGITVAKSVFVDGQWTDAQWDVACVDGGTGELIITAIVAGRDAPVVTALRMDMETARHLRTMAGFSGTPAAEPYDCRTTGKRLNALETEQRLASRTLHAALNEIERRLAALEAWQVETEDKVGILDARMLNDAEASVARLQALEVELPRQAQLLHGLANRLDALAVGGV